MLSLAGCNAADPTGNRGLSPILQSADVEAAGANSQRILDALAQDNGLDRGSPYYWYDVSVAGFNYVDDQCMAYFDRLFFLNRDKDLAKGLLNGAGQTANAILAVTKSSNITLAIVAQAFGFAISATDLVSGTFLYQLPPSTTLGFVKSIQSAFRQGAAEQRANVRSAAASYHLIQQYLSLCLPPTIEAELVKHISGAEAVPAAGAPGSVDVIVGSSIAVEPQIVMGPPAVLRSPNVRLPPVKGAIINPDGRNPFERSLSAAVIGQYQQSLCVEPASGRLDAPTRKAITEFFAGLGRPNPGIATRGLSRADLTELDKAGGENAALKTSGYDLCSSAPDPDSTRPFMLGKLMR